MKSQNQSPYERTLPEFVRDIQIPPLDIEPPRPIARKLASGATLLEAPDDSLPFLTIELFFHGGLDAEPVARAGTLEAMTRLMEIGGAGDRSGDQIALELARLGARLKVESDYETWSVQLTALKADFAPAFALLADVLRRPQFPAERLAVVQNGMLTSIKQRNDEPSRIAQRKLMEILYGDLRAGYHLQPADVAKIDVNVLRDEHKRRLVTDGLFVALSGDFRGLDVVAKCDELLAGLPAKSDLKIENMRRTENPYARKILLVRYPATQAAIVAGGYLPPHNHPDFYALQTGNFVLGGGSFNSRMMREIRARRGLAYYAYSANTFRGVGGTFFGGSGTRTAAVAETLRLMQTLIDDMHAPVEARELDLAREAILNSMVFQYADPTRLLENEVRFRRHGMPEDYLKKFAEKVRVLDTREVARVFAKNLRSRALSIVVAGPESLKGELARIRPVLVVEPEESGFREKLR